MVKRAAILVCFLFAIYILLPKLGQTGQAVHALKTADLAWIAATLAFAALTYFFAAITLIGATGERLPLAKTTFAQLASAFTNRLAPAGIGALTTNVRFLERTGIAKSAAVAAVGLTSVTGFLIHAAGLLLIVPFISSRKTHLHLFPSDPDLSGYWQLLIAVLVVLVIAGIVHWADLIRHHAVPPLRNALLALRNTSTNPVATIMLFGGAAGITMSYLFALVTAAHAFDTALSVGTIAAIYLGGTAIASASPTPGGLGAVEAALVAGFISAGATNGTALTSVLTFRLITYWLPILPGAIAYRLLRRADAL